VPGKVLVSETPRVAETPVKPGTQNLLVAETPVVAETPMNTIFSRRPGFTAPPVPPAPPSLRPSLSETPTTPLPLPPAAAAAAANPNHKLTSPPSPAAQPAAIFAPPEFDSPPSLPAGQWFSRLVAKQLLLQRSFSPGPPFSCRSQMTVAKEEPSAITAKSSVDSTSSKDTAAAPVTTTRAASILVSRATRTAPAASNTFRGTKRASSDAGFDDNSEAGIPALSEDAEDPLAGRATELLIPLTVRAVGHPRSPQLDAEELGSPVSVAGPVVNYKRFKKASFAGSSELPRLVGLCADHSRLDASAEDLFAEFNAQHVRYEARAALGNDEFASRTGGGTRLPAARCGCHRWERGTIWVVSFY
jgi:hypothetical protein